VVRDGQGNAELEAEVDALHRQALALGARPPSEIPPWFLLGVKITAGRERAAGVSQAEPSKPSNSFT